MRKKYPGSIEMRSGSYRLRLMVFAKVYTYTKPHMTRLEIEQFARVEHARITSEGRLPDKLDEMERGVIDAVEAAGFTLNTERQGARVVSLGGYYSNSRCALYVMRHENRVKIGISKDPMKRLSELRHTTGFSDIELCGITWFGSRQDALNAEGSLHRMYDGRRMCGEWFLLTGAIRRLVERFKGAA